MRKSISKQLCVAAAAMGAAVCVLRMILYWTGVDEKGLLSQGVGFQIAFWGLTAGMAVLAWVLTRKQGKTKGEPAVGWLPAVASVLMALGILQSLPGLWGGDSLSKLAGNLGLLAGGCLLGAAWMQGRRKKPYFLLSVAVCIFFAFQLISRYRLWSGNPQFQDYAFSMGASLLLMLYAYHQAAASLGMSTDRARTVLGALAGFFCLAALPHTQAPFLYLRGALWTLIGLWTLPESEESL